MKKYYYKIYGSVVSANIEMPLLNQVDYINNGMESEIELTVEYGSINNDGIFIKKDINGNFSVNINNYANYRIDVFQNKISCTACNYEAFFSTLFNIPFSVYFLLKNHFLFHACTLSIGSNLICIAGDKGVGKSTLCYLLNGDKMRLYSDDTILINNNNMAERAHNLFKMTDETINAFKINNITLHTNATGKKYGYINCDDEKSKLIHAIVQIKRVDDDIITIYKTSDNISKKQIFYHNLVGINYYDKNLIKVLLSAEIPQNQLYYTLSVPNSLEALQKEKQNIINTLLGEVLL